MMRAKASSSGDPPKMTKCRVSLEVYNKKKLGTQRMYEQKKKKYIYIYIYI